LASHLIEVEFKGNRREFFLWETDDIPPVNAAVIVEADRGEDLGRVHAVGDFASQRNRGVPHGTGQSLPSKRARRVASSEDVRKHDELRAQDEEARRKAMDRVRANALVMKVSDAEWQWDRKKLTFYFTAEKRVDFRTLVRELAATFRTRIELKQIGVRDEAKRLDGIGRCGRQYCSASWLPELRPVSLGVAKDQRLSLNPTQISGACGRLMCSLRYEHEFYVQARRRFPKEGKIVRTSIGEEKIIANDIFRERVVLRSSEGETRTIPLAQLLQESEAAGGAITLAVAPPVQAEPVVEADVVEPEEEVGPAQQSEDDAPAELTADGAAPEGAGERRPHRRRGRRGGRRNRGGRREGGPDGQGPAAGGTEGGGTA
jgi:cell fate regulator YaaT (PSP1 superfamily)